MALTLELAAYQRLQQWIALRNRAINTLSAPRAELINWLAYRTSIPDATDKAEVSAAMNAMRNLAGNIAGNQAATAGQANIDALMVFQPADRPRSPRHAQFIARAPELIAALAVAYRLARTDMQAFATANPTEAVDIGGSVTAINSALTAISNNDDAAWTAAVALLQV